MKGSFYGLHLCIAIHPVHKDTLTVTSCDCLQIWHKVLSSHHSCQSSPSPSPILPFYPHRSITPGVRQPDGLALDEFKEFKDMEQKVLVRSASLPTCFHVLEHPIACHSQEALSPLVRTVAISYSAILCVLVRMCVCAVLQEMDGVLPSRAGSEGEHGHLHQTGTVWAHLLL